MPPVPSKFRKYNTYQNPAKTLTQAQYKQVAKIAKSAAKRATEIKRAAFTGGVNLLDSSHYVLNPLYNISQGTGASNRIGQEIKLAQIDIKYSLLLNSSAPADVWVYAFWSDVESITSSTTPTQVTTANVLSTLPFVGAVTTNQSGLLQFDHFQATKLRDMRHEINPHFSGEASRCCGRLTMNFKDKKLNYLHDTASFFEGKNLYIGFVASANGTVDTSNVVALYHSTQITFRE